LPRLFFPTPMSLCLLLAGPLSAQDPFEIQVYEYQTTPTGRWNLETHLNYTAKGTTEAENGVAPSEGQTHLTFELTRGITDVFELAGYLVLASRTGARTDFAGWRLRPRVRAPESWNLPVGLSLSMEVGFPTSDYEENSATLEVRPIIEKVFGRLQVDLNPVIGRALSGPGTVDGWDLEPGGRLGITTTDRLDLSVEYYASLGSPSDLLPADEQVHQFFFGGDYALAENIIFNLGIGFGTTDVGNRLVYKSRLGWMF